MKRRELIQWLVATAGIGALAPDELLALGQEIHRRPATPTFPTRTQEIIRVAAERILPGATDANVAAFIEKILTDWHTPEERDPILAGLKELDGLPERPEGEQIATLTAIDQANPDWFARLKYLTVYGYCTSEIGMRELGLWPLPWRYDGCAPV